MSYVEHFGLEEQPFRLTPDPDFVYWSEQHQQAKSYLESTIWLADGFVILTGEIGAGKTTLLQSFLADLKDDVDYAVISQTQLSPEEFLQAVLVEYGFKPFGKGKAELIDMLNTFLLERYSAGRRVLLIVDEAQNLSRRVLEEIRLLNGLETTKEKVLRIIIAGQPELRDKINRDDLKQLTQRVRLRYHLEPLVGDDQRAYVEHRLKVAGAGDRQLFDDACYPAIAEFTGGVPRLINVLCDTAMLCAFADEVDYVSEEQMDAALEELGWLANKPATGNTSNQLAIQAQLELREKDTRLGEFELTQGRLIIGRTADNDIRIDSPFVSRHHAQIVTTSETTIIEDLNSTNGLFLGARRFTKRRLRDGDVVAVGNHLLIYKDFRDPAAESLAEDALGESSIVEALPAEIPAEAAADDAVDDEEFIIDLPEPGDVELDDLEVKDSQS
ncbi:MAG: AAA family ATPase [Pseudomonadota bacterium]